MILLAFIVGCVFFGGAHADVEYQLSEYVVSSCSPLQRVTTRLYVATYPSVGSAYNSLSYVDLSCTQMPGGSMQGKCENDQFTYQYYHTPSCVGAPYYQNTLDTSSSMVSFDNYQTNVSVVVACSINVVRASFSDSVLDALTESISVYDGACVSSPKAAQSPSQVVYGLSGTFRPLYPLFSNVSGYIYFGGTNTFIISDTDGSSTQYNTTTQLCTENAGLSAFSYVSSTQAAADMVTYELFYNQPVSKPVTVTSVNAVANWLMVAIYLLLLLTTMAAHVS